jgi:diguanylate cyclase (GGDEF)-like protein
MTGFDVCQKIAGVFPPGESSIIFVTALHDAQSEEHGLLLGAMDYILKPFSPPAVRARVRNHLALSRTTRELRRANEKLQQLAALDYLTGTFNRGHFEMLVTRELERAERSGQPGALLIIDLDHFKRINDTHGHAAGDQVLVAVTDAWSRELRACDVLGRIGGEEFAVFLPETGSAEAAAIAGRLLQRTRDVIIHGEGNQILRVTASIGGTWPEDGPIDLKAMMKTADRLLYQAKQAGRDRVEVHGESKERNQC